MDTDSLVVEIILNDFVKALQNVNDLFEFSNLGESLTFSSKKRRGKFKKETLEIIWIDFVF